MKKILNIFFVVIIGLNFVQGQNIDSLEKKSDSHKRFSKGTIFGFWGWNRAAFSKSDIHFKGDGYNFTLHNIIAHDRPAKISWNYIDPKNVSRPQFNARLGYFVQDDLALVVGTDHMKYVMAQNQTVDFTGYISDPAFAAMVRDGKIDLIDKKFLTYEHTDGLNYINLGLEKYKNLISKKNFDFHWAYGAGAGILFPKSNVQLFQKVRSDQFHVAGFGWDARTSINLVFWKHIMLRLEGKVGYINLPDVKTTINNTPDRANQDFVFYQYNFGIGYIFNRKLKK